MVPLHALIEEDGFAKVLTKEGAIRQTDRKTPEKDILFLFVIGMENFDGKLPQSRYIQLPKNLNTTKPEITQIIDIYCNIHANQQAMNNEWNN